LHILEVLGKALLDEVARSFLGFLFLFGVVLANSNRVVSIMELIDKAIHNGQRNLVEVVHAIALLGRQTNPRCNVEKDVGRLRNEQIAMLEGWWS
jgi:hypothetical protein